MLAVTTFPEWGWDVYAKKCISSWLKSWPGSVRIYFEGAAPPKLEGAEFRPLSDVYGWKEFQQYRSPPRKASYLWDAKRFSHKVFAQLDTMDDTDRFWWLDADVEMIGEPNGLIEDITSTDFASFLGRDSYTETGVIAFNCLHDNFREFQRRYRRCYDAKVIYELRYWTDCHAFDYARDGKGNNLTPNGKGFNNVLKESPLGEYFTHHKGNLKMHLEE